ncbi:MAG: transposase [Phycisphaerales bacterium]|nr:transposase [Planctomycetota bacterium]MCH8509544.1 transposase [Phycisphaerales bacterium]
MPPPEAYLLTWTTYGTHLRSAPSGSTDHAREGHGPTQRSDFPRMHQRDSDLLRHPPVVLTEKARHVVEQAIREHAAFKQWEVLAIAVRSNHVHLLVRAAPPPEVVMTGCKSWATRAMREAGLTEGMDKVWARHGSTRWINDTASLETAWRYIAEYQDGDLAARRYAGRYTRGSGEA